MKLKSLRVLAGSLAFCACVSVCSIPALAATDTSTFQEIAYSQVNTLQVGQRVVITGTPNYSAATSNATCNFFGFDTSEGVWYIAIGGTSVAAFQTAVPTQEITLYGMYAGTLDANGMPILDIQSGAVYFRDVEVLCEASSVFAAGTNTLAEQQAAAAASQTQVQTQTRYAPDYVYVPRNSKNPHYHYSSDCSGMKNPRKVKYSSAVGSYPACPKCVVD